MTEPPHIAEMHGPECSCPRCTERGTIRSKPPAYSEQECSCGGEIAIDHGLCDSGSSWPRGTPNFTYRCKTCGATRGPFVSGDY